MQMITDIAAARSLKVGERRALAVEMYDAALSAPDVADWRTVAALLRLAIPETRAKATAWVEYDVKKNNVPQMERRVIEVTFADGEMVRMSAATLEGKPFNWGRGVRVCIVAYRIRQLRKLRRLGLDDRGMLGRDWATIGAIRVPDIVHVLRPWNDETFPVDVANEHTAAERFGPFDLREAIAAGEATGLPHRLPDDRNRGLTAERYTFAMFEAATLRHLGDAANADRTAAIFGLDVEPAELGRLYAAAGNPSGWDVNARRCEDETASLADTLRRLAAERSQKMFRIPARLMGTSALAPTNVIAFRRAA